jgi:hypothetical protein
MANTSEGELLLEEPIPFKTFGISCCELITSEMFEPKHLVLGQIIMPTAHAYNQPLMASCYPPSIHLIVVKIMRGYTIDKYRAE